MISVKDIIFDENKVWNRKPISYFNNDIKKLNQAIIHVEIPELETKKMEDIQLVKDNKMQDKIYPIICQANHEEKDLDLNFEKSE